MRELFAGQMDYVSFIYGLAFVLLASTCFTLQQKTKSQIFWKWLGAFGLIHGINEWLDMLAIGLGDTGPFQWFRLAALTVSFVCLFEFGRSLCGNLKYAKIGGWIYVPIILVIFLDASNGIERLETTVGYSLGISAGFLAALALWRLSREDKRLGPSLFVAAGAMAVYALSDAFAVCILCSLAACGLGVMLWYYSEALHMQEITPAATRLVKCVMAGALLVLVVLLAGGWSWTEQRGLDEAAVQRAQLLNNAQQALMTVDPGLVRDLSGSAADVDNPGYQILKTRLRHLRGVMPAVRFIYLMRQAGDKIVFLVDSEEPGSKDESLPGQVYEAVTPKLKNIFVTKKGVVDDPATDRWGRWVSAYVPFNDPRTGELIAVLGVDQNARGFERGVAEGRLKGIIPVGIICFGVLFMFVYWRRFIAAMHQGQEGGKLEWLVEWGMAVIVAGVGLALTGSFFLEWRYNAHTELKTVFLQRSMTRVQVVSQELDRQIDRLDGLRRFMDSRVSAERGEFSEYTLPLLKDVPIRAFEWIPRVPKAERIAYESRARQGGFDGYQIYEKDAAGKKNSALDRDEYFPVYYVEPLKGNEAAPGYDLASEPSRRVAMEKARDTGSAVATQPLELVQEGQKKTGILLFMPVYAKDQPQRTMAQRRESLRGFVLAVYNADDFLKGVYSRMPPEGLACLVEDLAAPVDRRVLYRHVTRDGVVDWARPRLTYVMPLEIPDRQWRVTVVPSSAFMARNLSRVYLWTLPLGGLLTVLLAFFLNFLMMARYQAEKQVALRTKELKKEQQALREQHELLANVVEGTKAGTWRWDIQSGETVFNERWAQMIGYSLKELTPVSIKTWESRVHPDDLLRSRELLWGHFAGKIPSYDCEIRMKHKDGHWVWVHDRGQVVYKSDDGRPRVMFGTRVDISSRKQAEAADQKRFSELKAFLNNLPFLAWFKDADGRFIVVNESFAASCGHSSPEEVYGKTDFDIWPQHLAEAYRRDDEEVMAGRVGKSVEEVVRDKGEDKYFETYKAPLFDEEWRVTGTIGYSRDITDRKQAQDAMDKLKAQLIQSDKLASLGEMATGMAHEINQPLNAIGLVCAVMRKLMKKNIFTEEALEANLKEIESSVRRMTQTIKHVRTYARQEVRAFEMIAVAETVDAALILLGEQLRIHGIKVEKAVEPDLPLVRGEPHQLEQVWINFISNARDSMDEKQALIEKGVLNISGYQKKLQITVSHDKAAGTLLVAFTDNGKGLTAENARKVFEPFFTTKEVGKGTGLGLSISLGIIQSHNGRITIEGAPDEGATLKVFLPVT